MQHPRISSHHPQLDHRPRLGVFIDAENVSGHHAERLMQSVNALGKPLVCRAYGDWSTDFLIAWKKWLHPLGIRPVQQFHCAHGRNASDATLIMDVMEQLHTGRLDGICIASGDSNFVGLVCRAREHGPMVYGFGQHGASPAFVVACDEFVFLDGRGSNNASLATAPGGGHGAEMLLRQGLTPAPKPGGA